MSVALFASPSTSLAEGAEGTEGIATAVNVTVRTIRAVDMIPDDAKHDEASIQVDDGIRDLEPKLKKLQYKTFHLVDTREGVVPPRHKETMTLGSGSTLTLRPLGANAEKKRVCIWLKWQDAEGMDLLDTRMHFIEGESMLAGTDNSATTGMVLAIDVKSVPPTTETVAAE